jgi:hypothetical protein
MISESPDPSRHRRTGLLIDFDLALPLDEDTIHDPFDGAVSIVFVILPLLALLTSLQGTEPYISSEVLQDRSQGSRPAHDLEAFFYVFIWVCMCYDGPNITRRSLAVFDPLDHSNFLSWHDDEDGKHKSATITSDVLFFRRVILNFSPYFHDFRACACRLRKALFNHHGELRKDVRHDDILYVLDDTALRRSALAWQHGADPYVDRTRSKTVKLYECLLQDSSDKHELRRLQNFYTSVCTLATGHDRTQH